MPNFPLGKCTLLKNVHLRLILNTECFRRKTSALNELEIFFLIHKCFENYERISMKIFFSLILCTPKTLREIQFKFQKCLAKLGKTLVTGYGSKRDIMNCCYNYCRISFISRSPRVPWSIVLKRIVLIAENLADKSKVSILPFYQ